MSVVGLAEALQKLWTGLPEVGWIGLGGGQTVLRLIPVLARVLPSRTGWRALAATSATAEGAKQVGIPIVSPGDMPNSQDGPIPDYLDLLFDGADEVSPRLDLIKGYGGALTREKILACAARRRVYVVTPEKLVPTLGARGRLPVEVVRFGWPWTKRQVEAVLGTPAQLRCHTDDKPFVTDNGQYLLDCQIGVLSDPVAVYQQLKAIPGVVEVGLFLGIAERVIVLEEHGVRVLSREDGE